MTRLLFFLIITTGALAFTYDRETESPPHSLTPSLPLTAAADPEAKDIIAKSDAKLKGKTSLAEMKMTIVRPTWKRELKLKSWSKGDELALILILSPAREKGAAFLKRGREIWNWQPTIDRTIKLPPSMMSQSWMGSDFTNDDLVKQSSVVEDYNHKLLGTETIDGRSCYKIQMDPKESAAVVWGKVVVWIDKAEYMQLKAEFYDEDNYLVNTMYGKQVKTLGGKVLPSVMEVVPADEPGNKTIIEYLSLDFDKPMNDNFFSVQQMKKVK
ncbi:MAG: outer membrane lipoprotein-sorting protein [Saprospiraceae bacterium]|jgi:outer membrane lipoprotein-sorting protein|nr:outer membrane lipoprotein-sorting protein [Saprospiraceae bacterium]